MIPRATRWPARACGALAVVALAHAPLAHADPLPRAPVRRVAAAAAPAPPVVRRGAPARPQQAPAVPPPAARRAPARPAPPPAPVALQLTGVRANVAIPHAAIMHAIQRDTWPLLVRCVTPAPAVRGWSTVELVETDAGTLAVHVTGPALARDAALARCVRRAAGRLVLPAREDDQLAATVRFDLAFGLPPLPVAPPRRPAPRR